MNSHYVIFYEHVFVLLIFKYYMNNFENSDPFDYNKIFQKILKQSVNNNYEIASVTLMLKNMGYSKKRIQSEIKKYKRYKKKMNKTFVK